jgi:hypothetical protein
VIRFMGSARSTSTSELDRAGRQLLGSFYRGAYAAGAEPLPDGTQHVVIINQSSAPPGSHWMCLYREPSDTSPLGEQLLYDSFGRLPTTQWQPRLHDTETTETDAEQPHTYENGATTEYCGQACIAWACVAKGYGWNVARLV